jgi:hypothetical protein
MEGGLKNEPRSLLYVCSHSRRTWSGLLREPSKPLQGRSSQVKGAGLLFCIE